VAIHTGISCFSFAFLNIIKSLSKFGLGSNLPKSILIAVFYKRIIYKSIFNLNFCNFIKFYNIRAQAFTVPMNTLLQPIK